MTDETGWRPIAEAPTDGRLALIALAGGDICIAPLLPPPAEMPRKDRIRLAKEGIWPNFSSFRPTHWMPLPPPPTQET
jgi:hypothetical protein